MCWETDHKKMTISPTKHAHIPKFPFPCSCPHASILTCKKLTELRSFDKFFLTKDIQKNIASLSRLHQKNIFDKRQPEKNASLSHFRALTPMLHAHTPMLPFLCSCLHTSIVTCKKLALTRTGNFF